MSGAILETFILTEILKSYWHNGKRAPLYYYRDKDKKEIDLLIVQDDVIYPSLLLPISQDDVAIPVGYL
jgi:predicted AAA+ superfamily ATPase